MLRSMHGEMSALRARSAGVLSGSLILGAVIVCAGAQRAHAGGSLLDDEFGFASATTQLGVFAAVSGNVNPLQEMSDAFLFGDEAFATGQHTIMQADGSGLATAGVDWSLELERSALATILTGDFEVFASALLGEVDTQFEKFFEGVMAEAFVVAIEAEFKLTAERYVTLETFLDDGRGSVLFSDFVPAGSYSFLLDNLAFDTAVGASVLTPFTGASTSLMFGFRVTITVPSPGAGVTLAGLLGALGLRRRWRLG